MIARSDSPWSVRLLLTEDEARALGRPALWPIHEAARRMVVGGGLVDEVDEFPFVTLELAASDPEAAEQLARQLVTEVLREVGLPDRTFPMAWVAPLREGSANSLRFLEEAKELYDSERFELAIVAAQMHLELQLRLLLERGVERASSRWARRLIKNRRVAALANDVSIATVQLLLGVDVTQTHQWPEFGAHLARRNAVVHEGLAVGPAEAKASIKVVQALWAELAQAERS